MPSNNQVQEWIRTSQQTPGIFIFGLVMAPCGWILNLTSTVAPNWRTVHAIPGQAQDLILQQGIWDICRAFETSREIECSQQDQIYFDNEIINIAQGLMVASLIVTLIGLAVAIPGIRCWRERPNWVVAGLGGLLIFLSGVMTLIPISWYTNIMTALASEAENTSTDVRVGFCIVLGYIGGIFEVLGGFVIFVGICRCCGGKNRGEKPVEEVTSQFRHTTGPPPRRFDVPSVRSKSSASSVPYSKNSLDDEVDFPRAKSTGARTVNTSYSGRPYDADL